MRNIPNSSQREAFTILMGLPVHPANELHSFYSMAMSVISDDNYVRLATTNLRGDILITSLRSSLRPLTWAPLLISSSPATECRLQMQLLSPLWEPGIYRSNLDFRRAEREERLSVKKYGFPVPPSSKAKVGPITAT